MMEVTVLNCDHEPAIEYWLDTHFTPYCSCEADHVEDVVCICPKPDWGVRQKEYELLQNFRLRPKARTNGFVICSFPCFYIRCKETNIRIYNKTDWFIIGFHKTPDIFVYHKDELEFNYTIYGWFNT